MQAILLRITSLRDIEYSTQTFLDFDDKLSKYQYSKLYKIPELVLTTSKNKLLYNIDEPTGNSTKSTNGMPSAIRFDNASFETYHTRKSPSRDSSANSLVTRGTAGSSQTQTPYGSIGPRYPNHPPVNGSTQPGERRIKKQLLSINFSKIGQSEIDLLRKHT